MKDYNELFVWAHRSPYLIVNYWSFILFGCVIVSWFLWFMWFHTLIFTWIIRFFFYSLQVCFSIDTILSRQLSLGSSGYVWMPGCCWTSISGLYLMRQLFELWGWESEFPAQQKSCRVWVGWLYVGGCWIGLIFTLNFSVKLHWGRGLDAIYTVNVAVNYPFSIVNITQLLFNKIFYYF